MVDDALVLNVSVEASYHNLEYAAVRCLEEPVTRQKSGAASEVNTGIFAGSNTKFFSDYGKTTLLDTPDHFD